MDGIALRLLWRYRLGVLRCNRVLVLHGPPLGTGLRGLLRGRLTLSRGRRHRRRLCHLRRLRTAPLILCWHGLLHRCGRLAALRFTIGRGLSHVRLLASGGNRKGDDLALE